MLRQAGFAGLSATPASRPRNPTWRGARPSCRPDRPASRRRAAQPSRWLARRPRTPIPIAYGKRLIVGEGIRLSGEISSCDRLVVQGEVEVTLNDTLALEIAESGRFTGGCEVEEADISGVYEGDLTVRKHLCVRGTGKLTGTIRYAQLELERGGQIAGNVSVISADGASKNVGAARARSTDARRCSPRAAPSRTPRKPRRRSVRRARTLPVAAKSSASGAGTALLAPLCRSWWRRQRRPIPNNAFGRNSLTPVTLLCGGRRRIARPNIEKRRFNHSLIQHARCRAAGAGDGRRPRRRTCSRAPA